MKYKDTTLAVEEIQPMGEFLKSKGKEANFSSQVYYVLVKDQGAYVFKPIGECNPYELKQIIGEVAAYKISKKAGIGLVPKTKIVSYDGNIGSLQKFISDTINKEQYPALLSSNEEPIEALKLFWFIAGQWDTDVDNVLFTPDKKPVAIDNGNIANLQQVSAYGKPHFVKTFDTKLDNLSAPDEPIVIEGSGIEVLTSLADSFKDELPTDVRNKLNTKQNWASFTYFIKDHSVWRNFYDFDDQPNYFMKVFSRSILEKFKNINFDIFENAINKCINHLDEKIPAKFGTNKEKLIDALTQHFTQIFKGMEDRYKLAENYLSFQESESLPEVDNPVVNITGNTENIINS